MLEIAFKSTALFTKVPHFSLAADGTITEQ